MGVLSKPLQTVPVRFNQRVETSRGTGDPGHGMPTWLPRAEAEGLYRQVEILAAVSVLRPFQDPYGGSWSPGHALVGMPRDFAEQLEREGRAKIIDTEKQREKHEAAWREHEAQRQDLVTRARKLHDEGRELERQAGVLSTSVPAIAW